MITARDVLGEPKLPGGPWEAPTPRGLRAAQEHGGHIAVAFGDGWRLCSISELAFRPNTNELLALNVATEHGGLLNIPKELVKHCVRCAVPKNGKSNN